MMLEHWTSSLNGQTTSSDDMAILDKQALDTLVGLFGDEGPEAISGLIDEYFDEIAFTLPKMDEAVEQQDANALYVLAHTLKSSSANMGAASIAAIAKQIEAAARVGEWEFAISQLAELKAEQPQVQRALEAYRAALLS
jgi:HPt (histidine-containing phosphotransfer) domain-containing protein